MFFSGSFRSNVSPFLIQIFLIYQKKKFLKLIIKNINTNYLNNISTGLLVI